MKKSITALTTILGILAGASATGVVKNKKIKEKDKKIDKFKQYYYILNQWLILKQEGKTLEEYFINNGYKTIALYGMGELGNRMLDELKDTSIEVKYGINKDANAIYADIDVKDVEDELDKVDAIVVSAVFAYEDIQKTLVDKVDCPILSLEDIIYEI